MGENTAKHIWLESRQTLLQAMLRQVEINSLVKFNRMSATDFEQFQNAMNTAAKASKAMRQTIAAAPNDEELYAQMAASNDRLREEIEHQIKIVEQILARQS